MNKKLTVKTAIKFKRPDLQKKLKHCIVLVSVSPTPLKGETRVSRTNRSMEALFGLPVTTAWKLVNLSASNPPAEAAKLASDLAYSTQIVRACRNLSALAVRRGVEVVMALGQAEELRLAEQEWDTEVVPMVELFEEVTGEPWRFVRPEFSGSFSQYLREVRPLELDAELETVGGLVLSLCWQFGGGGEADAVRYFGCEASLRCKDGGVLAGHNKSSTAITSYRQKKTIHNLAYLRTAICIFMVGLFGACRRIGSGDMPLIEALLYHFRWSQGLALPPFLDNGVQEPCYRYGSEKEAITAVIAAASQGDAGLVISTSEHLRHIVRDVEPRFWRFFDARISTLLRLADRQKRLRDTAVPLPEKMRDRSGNFYPDFFEVYRIPGKPAKQRYTFLLVRDCQGDNPFAFARTCEPSESCLAWRDRLVALGYGGSTLIDTIDLELAAKAANIGQVDCFLLGDYDQALLATLCTGHVAGRYLSFLPSKLAAEDFGEELKEYLPL